MLPPEALLGFETSDDAAAYRLSDHLAGVLTVDFLTPMVDEPYDFGRIAAANALSDVFAMGGRPLVGLNVLALDSTLPDYVARDILRGGTEKAAEAGAAIMGGHSVDDSEPKYGLAVFGTVDPARIVRNFGAQPGDILYLTKPLGTGIMCAAAKMELVTESEFRPVIESMAELNRAAGEAMLVADVHAATDVTGFGLAGHLHEMLEASGCTAEIAWSDVPLFDRAMEFSDAYCRPARTFSIEEFAEGFAHIEDADADAISGVLCDPQTSGGILAAIPPEQAVVFEREFTARTGRAPWRIGHAVEGPAGNIIVR